MKYDITFTIHIDLPEVSVLDFLQIKDDAPFTIHVVIQDDEAIVICRGVEAQGYMALPEAMRKAQIGLSHALRDNVPAFNGRGLLWSDIVAADVRAVE